MNNPVFAQKELSNHRGSIVTPSCSFRCLPTDLVVLSLSFLDLFTIRKVREVCRLFNTLWDSTSLQNPIYAHLNHLPLSDRLQQVRNDAYGSFVIRQLRVPEEVQSARAVWFVRNGVACQTPDHSIRLFEGPDWERPCKILKGNTNEVETVIVLPNGWVASSATDGMVLSWNIEISQNMEESPIQILKHSFVTDGHGYLRFASPNGLFVFSRIQENRSQICCDPSKTKEEDHQDLLLDEEETSLTRIGLDFCVTYNRSEETVRIWSLVTRTCCHSLPQKGSFFQFIPLNYKSFAVISSHVIQICDVNQGCLRIFEKEESLRHFIPLASQLLAGYCEQENTICICHPTRGVHRVSHGYGIETLLDLYPLPNGLLLISDGTSSKVLDPTTGDCLHIFTKTVDGDCVNKCEELANGFFAFYGKNRLLIWNPATGNFHQTLRLPVPLSLADQLPRFEAKQLKNRDLVCSYFKPFFIPHSTPSLYILSWQPRKNTL